MIFTNTNAPIFLYVSAKYVFKLTNTKFVKDRIPINVAILANFLYRIGTFCIAWLDSKVAWWSRKAFCRTEDVGETKSGLESWGRSFQFFFFCFPVRIFKGCAVPIESNSASRDRSIFFIDRKLVIWPRHHVEVSSMRFHSFFCNISSRRLYPPPFVLSFSLYTLLISWLIINF